MTAQGEHVGIVPRTGRRWRRTITVVILAIASIVLLAGAVLAALVVRPPTDDPRTADAVVVLSGDHGERLNRAKELVVAGVAPTLVLAGTPDRTENLDMCAGRTSFDVVCLRPEPDNTRSEAAATAELARSRNWRTLVVVTSTNHVARARLHFDRCFPGILQVVGADSLAGADTVRRARVHEWFGLVHALGFRGC